MFVPQLTRRKNELTTAEKMKVKMKDRLPGVGVRIDDDAVTAPSKTFLPRDFGGGQKQMSERFLMLRLRRIERREMLARNDQNVRRRLRADVVKCYAYIVFKNFRRRNFARNNFAKNTIFVHNGKDY